MEFIIGFAIAAGMATLYFGQQKHDKRLRDGAHVDEEYIESRLWLMENQPKYCGYTPTVLRMTNKEKRAIIIAAALRDRAAQ
jgi:hypothetical protein